MREPDSLPTDPDDWPHDPATLFGIEPRAEEATIRRAYLKLVRRFKPDTHPQQFQLIRQAYETLLARAASVAPPSARESIPRLRSDLMRSSRSIRWRPRRPSPLLTMSN